ncbi:hypothetical protein AeRB84_003923 [Aphanomyces euteiches]|nr:hypothetical protein AeRB84_003923 [Aphanomyces euteiches]
MTGRNPGRGTLKTKKHKVALDLTWNTLPTDVIITIAFFIPDAADLFTYLEALRVFNVLGPLEHLHKLGTKRRHQDLWPSLTITTATLQSQFILSYEAIVKYYARVVIHDISDFQWLRTHLNPKVQVEWNANDLPVPEEILDNWTDLRITRLDCYFYSRDTSKLNEILPRLPHLSALKACLRDTLDYLCPLVAKSTQLTELQLITLMDDHPTRPSIQIWGQAQMVYYQLWYQAEVLRIIVELPDFG